MGYVAHVLNVFIASPGDTSEYRDAVEAALHRWNGMRSANAGVVLLPRRWEVDGVPLMGGDGQSQLNSQLVDKADIVIGIFHTRIGKATPRGKSGTAEEIERTHAAGKPVHVYRSTAPLPSDVDTTQIEELRDFLEEMQRDGLTGSFATAEDLQNQVHAAIELDLTTLALGAPVASPAGIPHALLRAQLKVDRSTKFDSKGRPREQSRHWLVITNDGDATALRVRLEMAPLGDGHVPQLHGDATPDLRPGDSFTYPTLMYGGVADAVSLTMGWEEDDGETYSAVQSVSLFG